MPVLMHFAKQSDSCAPLSGGQRRLCLAFSFIAGNILFFIAFFAMEMDFQLVF